MKWFRMLWPFGLIALAVLVWNYPVYAVSGKIESASAGKVKVLSSNGSIWSGQMQLGLSDVFTEHGDPAKLLAAEGLDASGIERSVRARFASLLDNVSGLKVVA